MGRLELSIFVLHIVCAEIRSADGVSCGARLTHLADGNPSFR